MKPFVIAGPCSAESQQQVLQTAGQLKCCGVDVFRAGIWKPRTHPGCFEGAGTPALEWLRQVKQQLGMKVCCEVASPRHVQQALKSGVDMVWIGARTSANPFLVQEIAQSLRGAGIPVLVKNPVSHDLDLWVGAFERLNQCGVDKLAAVHRGVTPFRRGKYRNDPAWDMAIGLKSRIPGLPLYCDPSHMAGDSAYVEELSRRALDLGFEGLMMEVHCNPSLALSDASQQLSPAQFEALMSTLSLRDGSVGSAGSRIALEGMRARIDELDETLLVTLSQRKAVSEQIGKFKKDNNIAIIQSGRWEEVMSAVLRRGEELGLDAGFVREIFELIHGYSISKQH